MRIKAIAVDYSLQGRDNTEKNDCTVRAYATAFGISYTQAHATLKAKGRKERKAFPMATFMLTQHKNIKPVCPSQTLASFLAGNGSKGIWLLTVRGHALTCKDGKVISDWFHTLPGTRVKFAWLIKAETWILRVNDTHDIELKSQAEAEALGENFKLMGNSYTIFKKGE